MRRLPATIEELAGRRAARWIRESTPGQFDRYGPEAQAELQDRAIERLGLVDSGLAWRAAHSGRTVYRSAEMADMLGAAQRGDFEVLLVGYVSRWQRNLRRTLELLEDTLHPAGVPVYFCDEEILSSSERHWDQLVDEAKDAERYSRRLARRIKEGYASKLVKERDPGGHPPFSFRRNEAKLLEPDPERLPVVRRIFELGAAGLADRMVAREVELPLFTVRGILTSPLYVGRLRDGEPARWAPLVPSALWEAAQATRARRATKTGRPADPRRPYALDMLHCAACGKRLTGDTGYYRHREPCAAFVGARPVHRGRGQSPGHAYRREMYEQIVEELLAVASIGAGTIADVVGEVNRAKPVPDRSAIDRIGRERERAMARYLRDRDAAALDRTMSSLDADQARLEQLDPAEAVPTDVAVRYVRDLPETWRKAKDGPGRQLLASALFDRIDVLGIQEATVHLSAHALRHGLAEALPAEVGILVSGRGERSQNDDFDPRWSSRQARASWRAVSPKPSRNPDAEHRCHLEVLTSYRYAGHMATKKKVTLYVDEDVMRAARVRAARTDKRDSEVVEDALRAYLGFDVLADVWARSVLGEEEAMRLAVEETHAARAEKRAARGS